MIGNTDDTSDWIERLVIFFFYFTHSRLDFHTVLYKLVRWPSQMRGQHLYVIEK
jgi:hypothetical protein